jgi:hypothetical protein
VTKRRWEDLKCSRTMIAPGLLDDYDRYEAMINRMIELEAMPDTEPLLVPQMERLRDELTKMCTSACLVRRRS